MYDLIMTNNRAQQYIHYLITSSETMIVIINAALAVFIVMRLVNADQPLEANDKSCEAPQHK